MTSIRIEMTGIKELTAQLVALGDKADRVVLAVVTKMTTETRALAIKGIQAGPKSGTIYEKYAPRRTHQASAPGQYPASDTGRLASSVNMVLPDAGNLVGLVGTSVTYGPHLEFGTTRMAARPWLLPSFLQAQIGVEKELKARFERKSGVV